MAVKSRVVLFALIRNNKVLIEKRPIKGFNKPQYLIPGGAINPLESLDQALRRELMEELGIIPIEYLLLTKEDLPGLYGNILKPFVVNKWQGQIPKFIMDKEDPYPLEWIEIEKALKTTIPTTKKIFELLSQYTTTI